MSDKEELIENYKKEKVKLEMNISMEEDFLLTYQLSNDSDSIKECQLRLKHLRSDLKNIENRIAELENGDVKDINLPLPSRNQLSLKEVPIDKGTASIGFTLTTEVDGSIGSGKDKINIHSIESQHIEKTYEIDKGEIIREIVTETKNSHKEKTKDNKIDVKSKVIK